MMYLITWRDINALINWKLQILNSVNYLFIIILILDPCMAPNTSNL
jgi:hypothetical protein